MEKPSEAYPILHEDLAESLKCGAVNVALIAISEGFEVPAEAWWIINSSYETVTDFGLQARVATAEDIDRWMDAISPKASQ